MLTRNANKEKSGLIKAFMALAAIVAACLLLTQPVRADIANGTANGGCPWHITDDGELIIGEDDRTYTFGPLAKNAACAPWYSQKEKIKSVSFKGTVNGKGVLNYMFYGCKNLTSVNGSFNTGNATTMPYMFYGCSSLSDISGLSSWNTGNVTNMENMFGSCSSLSDISGLSGWDMGNVTYISYMFKDCTSLVTVESVANWNTGNVTRMNSVFEKCSALTDITGLANWNTENVISMGNMFNGCSSLSDTNGLANWHTENVKGMGNMFAGCTSLSDINGLSGWSTKNVTEMNDMFRGCSSLSDISGLLGWDTENVTNMSNMFYACPSLSDISGVSGWNTKNVTSMYRMFASCSSLEDIDDLANWLTGNVLNMAEMFSNCASLKNVDGLLRWNTENVTNMSDMFKRCRNITNVNGLANWKTGNVVSMSYMFADCASLADISGMQNWNTENVANMAFMFQNCSSLVSTDSFANWKTGSLTNMKYMFNGCSSLADTSGFADWNTENVTVMDTMFRGCRSLPNVDGLAKWDTGNVTTMSNMFFGCSSLTNTDGLADWDTGNVKSMDYMFPGCEKIEKLNMSNWDTKSVRTFYYMLKDCNKINTVVLGPSFSNIGDGTATGTKAFIMPRVPDNSVYTGKWIRDDEAYGPYTANEFFGEYTPDKAGTWVWQERPTQYTIKFVAPEGASGSMPDQKVKATEAGTINPCEFKRFNYHFDRWIGSDGKTYADEQEIPANTFRAGYVLTLTGVMVKNENKVSFTEGVADIILHAGEKAIFPALPGGTLYQVMEETPSGWQIVDDLTRNTSGTIPANGTANAEFVNEYIPGTATVQLVATKTLDGRAPEDGAFTFCLKQDGEVVEEAVNDAAGVVMFKTLVFRQPGEYTYTISEVRGDDAGINYDTHEERVTITVTDNGAGTLTAVTAYQNGNAKFENETKPGMLTVTKQTDGNGDPDEEFIFEIRLTDELGRSLDSIHITS